MSIPRFCKHCSRRLEDMERGTCGRSTCLELERFRLLHITMVALDRPMLSASEIAALRPEFTQAVKRPDGDRPTLKGHHFHKASGESESVTTAAPDAGREDSGRYRNSQHVAGRGPAEPAPREGQEFKVGDIVEILDADWSRRDKAVGLHAIIDEIHDNGWMVLRAPAAWPDHRFACLKSHARHIPATDRAEWGVWLPDVSGGAWYQCVAAVGRSRAKAILDLSRIRHPDRRALLARRDPMHPDRPPVPEVGDVVRLRGGVSVFSGGEYRVDRRVANMVTLALCGGPYVEVTIADVTLVARAT